VIGSEGCSHCKMTQAILNKKGVEYEYKLRGDIPKEKLQEYIKLARNKGLATFPMIVKDEEIITIEEI
jgi:glutaredoxin